MPRQKTKKYKINTYNSEENRSNSTTTDELHRNVRFCKTSDGQLTVSTSFLTTQRPIDLEDDQDDRDAGVEVYEPSHDLGAENNVEVGGTEEVLLESAYLEYLAAMNPKPGRRRVRPPGVSFRLHSISDVN